MASGRPRSWGSCCCSMEAKAQFRSTTRVVGSAVLRPSSEAWIEPDTASRCSHIGGAVGKAAPPYVPHTAGDDNDRQPGHLGPRRVTEAEIRASFAEGWSVDAIE